VGQRMSKGGWYKGGMKKGECRMKKREIRPTVDQGKFCFLGIRLGGCSRLKLVAMTWVYPAIADRGAPGDVGFIGKLMPVQVSQGRSRGFSEPPSAKKGFEPPHVGSYKLQGFCSRKWLIFGGFAGNLSNSRRKIEFFIFNRGWTQINTESEKDSVHILS